MNKKQKEPCHRRHGTLKRERIMKLCVLLTCLFSFVVLAKASAQEERVNLDLKEVSLKTLFNEIQRQTALSFVYSTEVTGDLGKVTVKVNGETVESVLSQVLAGTGLTYRFEGDIIVIRRAERVAEPENDVKSVTVTGRVTDVKKQPLPGVTVQVKGVTHGTVTDVDGHYKLVVPHLKKFSLMLRFGIDVNTYKVNGMETVTKLYTRPGLNANYKIDGTSSLTLTAYAGSFTPSLSLMNEAEQRVSEYEIKRGNPNLLAGKPITSVLSYSKYWNKFSLVAYAMYNGTIDNYVNLFTIEGSNMVNTHINGGNFHSYVVGVNGVLRLLSNSLQLRLSPTFSHNALTGTYRNKHNRFFIYSEVYYSTGAFSFSGYYTSPQTILVSSPVYSKSKCDYGMTASWSHRGLFVQVGCSNIFNGKRDYSKNYFNYGAYNTFVKAFSRSLGAQVYLNLSYNFDFGRKVERQDVKVNTSSNSGILK